MLRRLLLVSGPRCGTASVWPSNAGGVTGLALDQRWRGADGAGLDGTNNATEHAIGRWIKERYRTTRTYKRKESVRNVCNLL